MAKPRVPSKDTVTLRVDNQIDQELLARALRASCFDGLTVKQFHREEARDVLVYLHAIMSERDMDRNDANG